MSLESLHLQPNDLVAVGTEPIDPGAVVESVTAREAGGTVLFLGTVRDHSPGKAGVTHLEYEAYTEQVVQKMQEIVDEVRQRWDVSRVAAVHRVGSLGIGEVSVAVAVSSSHRVDAFPAARYLIDELKRRAPIWKKEHWDGGAEWVREDQEHA